MLIPLINKIRDILRSEGITGKDSINHCICFVICRYLDEEVCDKLDIPKKYSYHSMFVGDDGKKLSELDIFRKFFTTASRDCLIYYLNKNLNMSMIKTFNVKSPINLFNILTLLEPLN